MRTRKNQMAFGGGPGEMAGLVRFDHGSSMPIRFCFTQAIPSDILRGEDHIRMNDDGDPVLCRKQHPAVVGIGPEARNSLDAARRGAPSVSSGRVEVPSPIDQRATMFGQEVCRSRATSFVRGSMRLPTASDSLETA